MNVLKLIGLAATLFCLSSNAGAVSVPPGGPVNLNVGDVLELDFADTSGTPLFPAEYVWEFTPTSSFDLVLRTYLPTASADSSEDGTIAQLRTASGAVQTSAASANCDSRFPTGGNGDCFIMRPTNSSSGGNQPGTVLFEDLIVGTTYFLEIDDINDSPSFGLIQIAAVPLPAAGMLFGSALLGAAVLRRKSIRTTLGMPGGS
ncbi:MAG: hypothetical protein AAF337_09430 [Pseudomonadota bacterium]